MLKYIDKYNLKRAQYYKINEKSISLTEHWNVFKDGHTIPKKSTTYYKKTIQNLNILYSRKWY